MTAIAESASATVAASRSTVGSMLVPIIISTIRSVSPGGPPAVSTPIKQKPLTWKWACRCASVMVIRVPAAWPMTELGERIASSRSELAWVV